jgi:Clp protease
LLYELLYMAPSTWMGLAASMAVPILAGGTKGMRFALPNTRIMIHQPSGAFEGQATDIKIQAQEVLFLKERINEILAKHTGQDIERIGVDSDRDRWMRPEEAMSRSDRRHHPAPREGRRDPSARAAARSPAPGQGRTSTSSLLPYAHSPT